MLRDVPISSQPKHGTWGCASLQCFIAIAIVVTYHEIAGAKFETSFRTEREEFQPSQSKGLRKALGHYNLSICANPQPMAPFLVSCGRLVLRSDSLSQMLHEVVVSLFCLTCVPNLQTCKLHRSGLSLFTEVNNCHAACANYLRIVRFRIIKSSNCK